MSLIKMIILYVNSENDRVTNDSVDSLKRAWGVLIAEEYSVCTYCTF